MAKLFFTKIHPQAVIPSQAYQNDAGLDLYAVEYPIILKPFIHTEVRTGLTVDIPYGYELQVRSRSGLAFNSQVTLANGIGTIDQGYKGEIKVSLMYTPDYRYAPSLTLKTGAIAQLVLAPVTEPKVYELIADANGMSVVNLIPNSTRVRDVKGFGSSTK